MKITIIHTDKDNKFVVSLRSVERFIESVLKDDSRNSVGRFREHVPYLSMGYRYYKDMPTWKQVIPAAEFAKDVSGNLQMKKCNGLLLLQFDDMEGADIIEEAKRAAAMFPSTYAAFVGADGRSLVVLVSYVDSKQSLPEDEVEAERLYVLAYNKICQIYKAAVKGRLTCEKPSLRSSFLMTVDATPYFNAEAMPMVVYDNRLSSSVEVKDNDIINCLQLNFWQ